jgi:biopolymer transport protein ExbD
MKTSRRIQRMSRNRTYVTKMNLTSLMDVFTILVFFLLVNSATSEVLETPKQITLPDSVVESKPRETVVIFVSADQVLVQGKPVANVADILELEGSKIEPISARLAELAESVIGVSTRTVAESQEVTILADKSVPFSVVKKIMSTCTGEGYGQISLAVIQKGSQIAQTT